MDWLVKEQQTGKRNRFELVNAWIAKAGEDTVRRSDFVRLTSIMHLLVILQQGAFRFKCVLVVCGNDIDP